MFSKTNSIWRSFFVYFLVVNSRSWYTNKLSAVGTAMDKIDVTGKSSWINISTLFESSYPRYVTSLTVRKEQYQMKQSSGNQSFQKSVGKQ